MSSYLQHEKEGKKGEGGGGTNIFGLLKIWTAEEGGKEM